MSSNNETFSELHFTTNYQNIPKSILSDIHKTIEIDFVIEKFKAICFYYLSNNNKNPFNFLLITIDRIIIKSEKLIEIKFTNITGIETDLDNIITIKFKDFSTKIINEQLPKLDNDINIELIKMLNEIWIENKDNKNKSKKNNENNDSEYGNNDSEYGLNVKITFENNYSDSECDCESENNNKIKSKEEAEKLGYPLKTVFNFIVNLFKYILGILLIMYGTDLFIKNLEVGKTLIIFSGFLLLPFVEKIYSKELIKICEKYLYKNFLYLLIKIIVYFIIFWLFILGSL